jgi:hypothetical protein
MNLAIDGLIDRVKRIYTVQAVYEDDYTKNKTVIYYEDHEEAKAKVDALNKKLDIFKKANEELGDEGLLITGDDEIPTEFEVSFDTIVEKKKKL